MDNKNLETIDYIEQFISSEEKEKARNIKDGLLDISQVRNNTPKNYKLIGKAKTKCDIYVNDDGELSPDAPKHHKNYKRYFRKGSTLYIYEFQKWNDALEGEESKYKIGISKNFAMMNEILSDWFEVIEEGKGDK